MAQQQDDDPLGILAARKKQQPVAPADSSEDDPLGIIAARKAPASPSTDSTAAQGTPAPRRGIAGALGSLIDGAGDFIARHAPRMPAPDPAALNPLYQVQVDAREDRTIERPDATRMMSAAEYAREERERPIVPKLPLTQRADVTDAAGVARTRGPSPDRPTQTVAEDRQRRLTMAQNQQAAEKSNFSPEKWAEIAEAGMLRAAQLRANGDEEQANDIERKARNARLLSENSAEADTFGAIALSNLLGIVSDPYAQQRRNIAEAAAPGATFSPEETAQLDEGRVSTQRPFDTTKDLAAPLVGQLPVFVATGAAGRLATGAAGAFAEARGAKSIGQALTRISQLGEEAAPTLGPRIPVRSIPLARARIAQEVSEFRAAVPAMMARGVTEGQAVGAVLTYKQAREQGASVEDALGAAAEGVPLNIVMGVVGEALISGAGKALGLGFDPVGRVIRDIREGRGLEDAREVARPVDRRGDVQQREVGRQRATLVEEMERLLGTKRTDAEQEAAAREEATRAERQQSYEELFGGRDTRPADAAWWEEHLPPESGEGMVEPASTLRARGRENPPLRTAREIAMGERPIDRFNAVKRMERERAELREQVTAEATDPNLALERAALESPDRVQGPRTLRETLADVGPAAEQGDELAAGYTKAINEYVDALSAVQDAGDKGPNTRMQVKLARARQALNEARKKYGTQLGASAVLALAAANDDLTDDEKSIVGLASIPLAGRVVKHIPAEVLGMVYRRLGDNIERGVANLAPGVTRSAGEFADQVAAMIGAHGGQYREAILTKLGGDAERQMTVRELHAALKPDAGSREPLYSRLRVAVQDRQQFPKKWDEPRPAADWIGKLKGSSSFSKKELELILPALEEAQAAKRKMGRADLLTLIEEKVPRIDRVTLSDQPTERAATTGDAADGDPNDIHDIDTVLDDDHWADYPRVERIQDQIDNRRARITEIDEEIERAQESAAEEMESADRLQMQRLDELHTTLEGAGLDRDAADDAISYIDEHTYGDEPADVERAFEKIQGDLYPEIDYKALLDENDFTIGEEPEWSVELRHSGHEGSYRQTFTYDDLFEFEAGEDGGVKPVTLDEARAALEDYYRERNVAVVNVEERDDTFVVRNREGKRVAWSDYEDDAMREAVESEGLGPDVDELYDQVRRDLSDYADARAEWMRAESEHYDATENVGDRFEQEITEKEKLESEIPTLESALEEAEAIAEHERALRDETGRRRALEQAGQLTLLPEEAGAAPEPAPGSAAQLIGEPEPEVDLDAQFDEPEHITVKGAPKYATYQRINDGAGATEYRELPSIVENHQGDPYARNHYASSAGLKNVGAHVRAEARVVHDTPGLTTPKVEYFPGEPENERVIKSKIGEVRKKRDEALKAAYAINDEYEALPKAKQDDPDIKREYLDRFQEKYQHAVDQGAREEELAGNLRDFIQARTGNAPESRKVHLLVESQMDWAQDATKYGVRGVRDEKRVKALEQEIARVRPEIDQLEVDIGDAREVVQERRAQWEAKRRALRPDGSAGPELRELAADFERAMNNANNEVNANLRGDASLAMPDLSRITLAMLERDEEAIARDWLTHDPRTAQIVKDYLDGASAFDEGRQRLEALQTQLKKMEMERVAATGEGLSAVPQSPFTDTATAAQLNAARFLRDVADREGAKKPVTIAISDAGNREMLANLPPGAARLVYDELTPGAIKRLLGMLGFKDVKFEKMFISGYGHNALTLTPEMLRAIRKYGLPIMGLMALTPSESKAQGDGESSSVSPYASAIGGIAIGAALMYAAQHRAARRLIHENRELARIVQMDDLSGLANKRAWDRARPNIDADENFGVVAMDGDGFGQLNKKRGHSAGDKAIQHFGEVLRQAAVELDIPLRAFRKGGDEFVYGAPKEKLAALVRYIEQHSAFEDGGVKTKLAAAMGDTFEEADASLIALKAQRKKAAETPYVDAILAGHDEFAKRQDVRIGMGGQIDMTTFHANPVGLALQAIRRSPTAASIAALGVALAESDDEDLKNTSPYMIGLAALSAIGSGPLLAGKDALVKATVEMMQKIGGENVVRAFNPEALLDPSVKDAIAQYEKDRARAVARAREFSSKAKALGPEGDRAVSDILENEGWEDTSGFTPELMNNVLAVASALEQEYSATAAEQLASGARTSSQLLDDYGGPRRYAAIEAEAVQRDKPGYVPPRSTRIGEMKRRTLDIPVREAEQALAAAQATGDPVAIQAAQDKLTEAEMVRESRRVELGEIREASYRAAQGIEAGYANAAAARLFTTLKNVPGVVHPESVRLTDELKTAKAMLAAATTQADRDAATQLVQSATFELDKLRKEYQRKGGEYVSLADSKGLGDLRGAVVKRDVAHSITGFSDDTSYKKLLRQWKELKTIFNVGTHIANVVSNFTFAHMEGLLLHQQPMYLKRALADMKKYGDATRALAEGGVLDQNAVTADGSSMVGRDMRSVEGLDELRETTRPETRTVLEDHGLTAAAQRARTRKSRLKGAAAGAAIGAAALASDEHPEDIALGAAAGAGIGALVAGRGRGVRKLYNNEDNIFRVAIYLKKIDDGMSKDDALRYAQSALGNFRTRSPALNLARTTLAPFILYPAKAVPRFARQMIDHPWRYVALMAAWGALNEYAEADEGEIPDSDLPIKDRTQSKWGYFFPGFTQLPTQDEQGNKGATDLSRWTPMSGVSTGTPPGSVTGTLSEKLPAILQPSGPVLDAAAKLYGNVDPMTGRARIKRDYPTGENIATLLNDASELALPPALGFHRARLQEDIENRDFAKFRTDVLGPTGLRPRFVRPGANISAALHQLETSLSDMEFDFKREVRNNKDQRPERTQALVDRYLRRRKSAIDNFIERTSSTPPADLVRPPEME